MGVVQIVTYASAVVFVIAVIARVIRYVKTPISVRWELYPVAHEKGRHEYGGSVFEEPDWWTKPRELDKVNELKEMAAEIFFLKGVYHNNRKLWTYSFPFHVGLYLLIGLLGLLFLGAILSLSGVYVTRGAFGVLTAVVGFAGLGLTTFGAIGLLARRMGNPEMRRYNTPVEYLNLIFFIGFCLFAIVVHALLDPLFVNLSAFVGSLISFQAAASLGAALALEIVVGALLIAYIPLTRMSHFVAKYFLYHDVRWGDEPNPRGSKIEARVLQALQFGVSWNAPHIQTGKSWGEVATEVKE